MPPRPVGWGCVSLHIHSGMQPYSLAGSRINESHLNSMSSQYQPNENCTKPPTHVHMQSKRHASLYIHLAPENKTCVAHAHSRTLPVVRILLDMARNSAPPTPPHSHPSTKHCIENTSRNHESSLLRNDRWNKISGTSVWNRVIRKTARALIVRALTRFGRLGTATCKEGCTGQNNQV